MQIAGLLFGLLPFAAVPTAIAQTVYPATCNGAISGQAGRPQDFHFTSVAGAVTVMPATGARIAIHFQVPTTLTGGLWLNYTTTATGGSGDFYYAPGYEIIFDTTVVGTGAISAYTTTAGVVIPFTEC